MFNKNDKIVFFGDSITADGRWIAEVTDFLIENENEKEILTFNCGVPGDNATNALRRIYGDCLNYSPNHVVVMFGMNDIVREYYDLDDRSEETYKKRESAIVRHKKSITQIYDILSEYGCSVIVCTPTPYDEWANIETKNFSDCNIGLSACREFVLNEAQKRGFKTVDFNKTLTNYRKENEEEKIINDDRVHPNDKGHHIMAETFLKSVGLLDEEKSLKVPRGPKNTAKFKIEQDLRNIAYAQWILFENIKGDWSEATAQKQKIVEESKINGGPYRKMVISLLEKHLDTIDVFRGKYLKSVLDLYK